MAEEKVEEGKTVKLNFAKKHKETVSEREQEAPPEDEEPKDNDGDVFDWEWEVASFKEVFSFFSKVFETAGYGDVELDETDHMAIGYLFRLLEKRSRLVQP